MNFAEAQHHGSRLAAAFDSACKDRDPEVGPCSGHADKLISAVQAEGGGLREMVAGAMLKAYRDGQASVRASIEGDAKAERAGLKAKLAKDLRQMADELDR